MRGRIDRLALPNDSTLGRCAELRPSSRDTTTACSGNVSTLMMDALEAWAWLCARPPAAIGWPTEVAERSHYGR